MFSRQFRLCRADIFYVLVKRSKPFKNFQEVLERFQVLRFSRFLRFQVFQRFSVDNLRIWSL